MISMSEAIFLQMSAPYLMDVKYLDCFTSVCRVLQSQKERRPWENFFDKPQNPPLRPRGFIVVEWGVEQSGVSNQLAWTIRSEVSG